MKTSSKEIVRQHQRLLSNLKALQRLYGIDALAEATAISKQTWIRRMKEPWSAFSVDDMRLIAKFCNVDFVKLIDGELKIM